MVCVVCVQTVKITARFSLADDVTTGMPGPRAGSSWFQPRGGSTTTGLRSTGAVKRGATKLIQPVRDYLFYLNIYGGTVGRFLAQIRRCLMSPPVSPHPLDDDLGGRCAGLKFPLTFASAQQHRSIAKRRRHRRSAPAPAAAPLNPPFSLENTGAFTAF